MKERDKHTTVLDIESNCVLTYVWSFYKAYMLWIWIKLYHFDNLNVEIAQPLNKKIDQADI